MKRTALLALLACACAHSSPKPAAVPVKQPAPAARATERPAPARPGDLSAPSFRPQEPLPASEPFAEVRAEVDALLRAQAEALWAGWTRGERVDLSRTYQGHDRIFTAETVRRVGDAARAASGDERRALQLLHGFLAGEHLERETREAATRLSRARAGATIAWGGQTITSDRAAGLLAAEPDAARRTALYRLQADAVSRWAPQGAEVAQQLDAAARRLGHPSAAALGAELRGATPDELSALAERVLTETDAAYQEVMDSLARAELGRPWSEVRGADLPRLFRTVQDPRLFPASRLIPDARGVFSGLRLALDARPGVVLDLDARAHKDPRALALPVEVPGDVRLSAVPGAGIADLRALLHEMALVSFYSRIESPRVEFRRLGNTTAETWALLFEELAGDPQWLLERASAPSGAEHHLAPAVRFAAARRLHAAREAAVRLLVELRRPANDADAARTATALLERAAARRVSPEEVSIFLAERDPLLQSAVGLRAAVLAAQGEAFFRAGAGPAWWKDPRTGAFLARAFAEGSRPDASDLSAAFSSATLQPSALAIRARELLGWADSH